MKKTLLTTILLGVAVVSSLAQGQIDFRNGTSQLPPPPDHLVRFMGALGVLGVVDGTPVANYGGKTFVAQLYYAGNGAAAVADAPSVFRATTSTAVGTWTGGVKTLLNTALGGAASLEVRAWDNAFGSYDAALAAGGIAGKSAAFSYTAPASATAPPADYFMNNFVGFSIQPVPEPSTIALGVLGLGSLLFLRRRK